MMLHVNLSSYGTPLEQVRAVGIKTITVLSKEDA